MAQDILIVAGVGAPADFTITLANLASGAMVSSNLVTTSGYQGAFLAFKITSGATAPRTGGTYDIYIVRSDTDISDDNITGAGTVSEIKNLELIGSIQAADSANTPVFKVFNTTCLGPFPPKFGIVVANNSGAKINSDSSLTEAQYTLWRYQLQ